MSADTLPAGDWATDRVFGQLPQIAARACGTRPSRAPTTPSSETRTWSRGHPRGVRSPTWEEASRHARHFTQAPGSAAVRAMSDPRATGSRRLSTSRRPRAPRGLGAPAFQDLCERSAATVELVAKLNISDDTSRLDGGDNRVREGLQRQRGPARVPSRSRRVHSTEARGDGR